jgi:hypothetical protein
MGIFMLSGGAQKQIGGDEGGGILGSKFSQNLISVFIFWLFYILTDNFLFLWDYGLAKKNYIKNKNALDKLYISIFTQMGSIPSEIAPHSPMVKFLFMLQMLVSMWINLGSGLGGVMAAASSVIGQGDDSDSV